jgi:hypothetical protein
MTVAFVLGNGTSRLNVDPNELKKLGSVYACNAIYRDFTPDYLIAVDSKMIVELVENNVQQQVEIWTNYYSYVKFEGINYFNPSKGWSSGPTALWLASTHSHTEIYILGFDYTGVENNTRFNNVYAGTKNYKKRTDPPTYFGNWLNQTETTVKSFSKVKYYRVIEAGQFIPDWKHSNIQHIDYTTFKKQIKYQNC